ncbi:hypothetical protein OG763_03805 [Streptomyces sp. NBC_01230]|uniref:hypothetical protein n=1 Tax=Streptomyces sp. NBC_01230 TaxID=2903784 RepID=UPI002E0DB2CA|nr:hypothetical protein OG763_03805 [Streptomyces sp. NBC_01230]
MARPKPSEVDDELWAVIEPLLPIVELGAPVDIDQLQRRISLLEQDLSEKRASSKNGPRSWRRLERQTVS